MKTFLVIIGIVLILALFIYTSARFYMWAWAIDFDGESVYVIRPWAACCGLVLFAIGMSLAFGPLFSVLIERVAK